MTKAVCLHCGAEKFGAFVPCRECDFLPGSSDEQARALLLTSHYLTPEQLKEASTAISSGRDLKLPPDVVAQVTESIEQGPSQEEMFERWSKQAAVTRSRLVRIAIAVAILSLLGVILYCVAA